MLRLLTASCWSTTTRSTKLSAIRPQLNRWRRSRLINVQWCMTDSLSPPNRPHSSQWTRVDATNLSNQSYADLPEAINAATAGYYGSVYALDRWKGSDRRGSSLSPVVSLSDWSWLINWCIVNTHSVKLLCLRWKRRDPVVTEKCGCSVLYVSLFHFFTFPLFLSGTGSKRDRIETTNTMRRLVLVRRRAQFFFGHLIWN